MRGGKDIRLRCRGISGKHPGITVMCTLIFQHIVDHFMVHSNAELMRMVNVVFTIIIVLYIIRLGIYIIRGIVGARISRDIEKKLLDDFLGDLLKVLN